ncbi:hypothetical protein KPL37_15990 [Clostridium frigoris]|uniref:S1 motif domain-containing protein n=1 Tax=Clostridium frigoris TaxID=205327 RepID=A0ABS6BX91_9CLOT|nr:hypothetical protein [Clostridium frigoris]MBU3161221.1 hypothetical protein [Clostridium frigoris]
MSYDRINEIEMSAYEGIEVKGKVLAFDKSKQKYRLSIKQAMGQNK